MSLDVTQLILCNLEEESLECLVVICRILVGSWWGLGGVRPLRKS
jgi:hypothetical protein